MDLPLRQRRLLEDAVLELDPERETAADKREDDAERRDQLAEAVEADDRRGRGVPPAKWLGLEVRRGSVMRPWVR